MGPLFNLGQTVRLIREQKRGPREFVVGCVFWNGAMKQFYYGMSDTSAWMYSERELKLAAREHKPGDAK